MPECLPTPYLLWSKEVFWEKSPLRWINVDIAACAVLFLRAFRTIVEAHNLMLPDFMCQCWFRSWHPKQIAFVASMHSLWKKQWYWYSVAYVILYNRGSYPSVYPCDVWYVETTWTSSQEACTSSCFRYKCVGMIVHGALYISGWKLISKVFPYLNLNWIWIEFELYSEMTHLHKHVVKWMMGKNANSWVYLQAKYP